MANFDAPIALYSPTDYQVFQRQTRLQGTISVRGRDVVHATEIDAKITGSSLDGPLPGKWQKLSLDVRTGEFRADLKATAGGFYVVEFRALDGDAS